MLPQDGGFLFFGPPSLHALRASTLCEQTRHETNHLEDIIHHPFGIRAKNIAVKACNHSLHQTRSKRQREMEREREYKRRERRERGEKYHGGLPGCGWGQPPFVIPAPASQKKKTLTPQLPAPRTCLRQNVCPQSAVAVGRPSEPTKPPLPPPSANPVAVKTSRQIGQAPGDDSACRSPDQSPAFGGASGGTIALCGVSTKGGIREIAMEGMGM